jgi:hypothetical protein
MLNARAASVLQEYHGSRRGVTMFVCSNESEELELERGETGTAWWSERRLVGLSPWDTPNELEAQMSVMPLLLNLQKHILTWTTAYFRSTSKVNIYLRHGYTNSTTAIFCPRKAKPVNLRMRACTPPICNIGNALYRWRFPRLD